MHLKNHYLGCLGGLTPSKMMTQATNYTKIQKRKYISNSLENQGIGYVDATKHLKLVVNVVVCMPHL